MTTLAFGLRTLPENITTAWGARLIWPDDLVWNRQDLIGENTDELRSWLNGGALRAALDESRRLASEYAWSPRDDKTVTLYEDERGIVRGNPQGSHGYVYVAAWLKSSTG